MQTFFLTICLQKITQGLLIRLIQEATVFERLLIKCRPKLKFNCSLYLAKFAFAINNYDNYFLKQE